jgi:hypothetical protein
MTFSQSIMFYMNEILISQVRIDQHITDIQIYELMMIDLNDRKRLKLLKSESAMMIDMHQSYINEVIVNILNKENKS